QGDGHVRRAQLAVAEPRLSSHALRGGGPALPGRHDREPHRPLRALHPHLLRQPRPAPDPARTPAHPRRRAQARRGRGDRGDPRPPAAGHRRRARGARAPQPAAGGGRALILQYPADVAGLTLRVLEAGTGNDNVVLLHGVAARADRWRENLGPLSEAGLHPYALDLPGHGFSSHDPGFDYSAPAFAEVVAQFIVDRLGGRPTLLIGTSLGGHVTARLTLAHPELVSAAVLVGPTGMRPLGEARRDAIARGIVDASLEGTRAKLKWLVHDPALATEAWALEESRINGARGTHAAIEQLAAYFR